MIDPITTTQIFIDKGGNSMTRCWDEAKKDEGTNGQIMSVVPTDPSQVRRKRQSMCAVIKCIYKTKSKASVRTNIFDPI